METIAVIPIIVNAGAAALPTIVAAAASVVMQQQVRQETKAPASGLPPVKLTPLWSFRPEDTMFLGTPARRRARGACALWLRPWWDTALAASLGPGGGGDIGSIICQACLRELGERLRPTARLLVQKIMDGTAGNVPTWGYEILACTPDESINALVPHLADDNIVMRERATVALGYMGPAASSARERVTAALAKVSSEREKRLMEWCLREISRS